MTFANRTPAEELQLCSTNSIRKVPDDLAITSFYLQRKLTQEWQTLCCHSTMSRGLTSKVSTTDKPANCAATQTARTRPSGRTFVSFRNSATQRNTQGVAPLACDGSHLLLSATAIQRRMTEIINRKEREGRKKRGGEQNGPNFLFSQQNCSRAALAHCVAPTRSQRPQRDNSKWWQ